MRLAPRQGAGVAAKEGQVRCEFLTKRHILKLSVVDGVFFERAPELLQPR